MGSLIGPTKEQRNRENGRERFSREGDFIEKKPVDYTSHRPVISFAYVAPV